MNQNAGGAEVSERTQPVAVICAIELEIAHIRARLPDARESWRANRRVWLTELAGVPIVLSLCGVGMQSAAAATEAVILGYRPRAVLNYGCAGAHRADLLLGDIVVGTRSVAYDSIREDSDGTVHYQRMHYLLQGAQQSVPFLPAAPALLEHAQHASATLEGRHTAWPREAGWPDAVEHRPPKVHFGAVASADRWNRTARSIGAIVALHDSLCEDMEAAAIALTCASHAVPFLTVKDISNNEILRSTTSGSAMAAEVGREIGRRAAVFVFAVLRSMLET